MPPGCPFVERYQGQEQRYENHVRSPRKFIIVQAAPDRQHSPPRSRLPGCCDPESQEGAPAGVAEFVESEERAVCLGGSSLGTVRKQFVNESLRPLAAPSAGDFMTALNRMHPGPPARVSLHTAWRRRCTARNPCSMSDSVQETEKPWRWDMCTDRARWNGGWWHTGCVTCSGSGPRLR